MQNYSFPSCETAIDQAVTETLGSSASSITALQTTALIRQMDVINRAFVNSAHTRHSGGAWSWMQTSSAFQTKDSTTVATAYTSGTSLTLTDSSDYASTGSGWARTSKDAFEFVTWSANAGNVLTITALSLDYAVGSRFETLYALPSDYAKARRLLVNGSQLDYRQQQDLPTHRTYYTRGAFIILPEGIGECDASLWYEKRPTDLSTGTDATDLALSLDIPHDFFRHAVESLKAYIYMIRRKEDKAQLSLQLADMELDKALSYDVTRTSPQGLYTE